MLAAGTPARERKPLSGASLGWSQGAAAEYQRYRERYLRLGRARRRRERAPRASRGRTPRVGVATHCAWRCSRTTTRPRTRGRLDRESEAKRRIPRRGGTHEHAGDAGPRQAVRRRRVDRPSQRPPDRGDLAQHRGDHRLRARGRRGRRRRGGGRRAQGLRRPERLGHLGRRRRAPRRMERLADVYESHGEDIAQRVSMQNGMPIAISRAFEAVFPPSLLRYYAGLVRERPSRGDPRRPARRHDPRRSASRSAWSARSCPWNYPCSLTAFKLAPGAGRRLHDGHQALAGDRARRLRARPSASRRPGCPPGVVNIVPGDREIGAYLVSHPGVDKVAFTGSTAAGRTIAEVCGRLLRPVTLELGGKSAAIVLDDADLAGSVEALFQATLLNNGQTCFLGTRVLAPRTRYDEVVGRLQRPGRLAEGRRRARPRDPDRPDGQLDASRPGRGLHRQGQARRARAPPSGGGRPEGIDEGLVRGADDLRRRRPTSTRSPARRSSARCWP